MNDTTVRQDAISRVTTSPFSNLHPPTPQLRADVVEPDTEIPNVQSPSDATHCEYAHSMYHSRTLPNSTLDKAPEVVPEVSYRPSTNKEADVHLTARSDSRAQLGGTDGDHISNKTGKLRVSMMCSTI
jgi:hypothetical protein